MATYQDRAEAAARLAAALPAGSGRRSVVIALPRGGVPIAEVLCARLGATLDLQLVRKVGAPGNPELALAAVTGPKTEDLTVNEPLRRALGLSLAEVRALAQPEICELERRRALWLGSRPAADLTGRSVIVVDDGLATGATAAAALKAVRRRGAAQIILAVPVALGHSLDAIGGLADRIVCPLVTNRLDSVGGAYAGFPQIDDGEVAQALRRTPLVQSELAEPAQADR